MQNKYVAYFLYIVKHKWLVFKECAAIGLFRRGVLHDLSKFSPAEFFPYADRFFSNEERTAKKDAAFHKAVLHHYQHNEHHPEHWVINGEAMPMADEAMLEMLCDWSAMDQARGGGYNETRQWFILNRTQLKELLHPLTLMKVEWVLDCSTETEA
jgi:hypothetical protein